MSTHSHSPRYRSLRSLPTAMVMLLSLTALPGLSRAEEAPHGAQGMKHAMPMESHCMSMTGDKDYDFAINMRRHHQMALMMAEAQLENGKDAAMHDLASATIAAQKKEIAELDGWIATHEPSKTAQSGH